MAKTIAALLKKSDLQIVTYAYAALLVVLTLLQLVGFEATVAFVQQLTLASGAAASVATVVAIGMQIFGLPYLLGVKISPLMRKLSAFLCVFAPAAWAAIGLVGLVVAQSFLAAFVMGLSFTAWVVALVCWQSLGLARR